MNIPSTKKQITNKSQHAAQAPALRVTQIQNSKPEAGQHAQRHQLWLFNAFEAV
jgi:hypothetical protein